MKTGKGRKKIEIQKITNEASRMVTFSKRRQGLFRKNEELELLTGSRVASVIFSPTGRPYTYGDVNAAVERHFSARSMERSTSELNSDVVAVSGESSSSTTPKRSNALRDWVKSIDVEDCQNMNKLLLLKAQLEGTREKIGSVEESEAFQALFV